MVAGEAEFGVVVRRRMRRPAVQPARIVDGAAGGARFVQVGDELRQLAFVDRGGLGDGAG